MNDYIKLYNKNTSNTPVRPGDIKRIDGNIVTKTGVLSATINNFLRLRTGVEAMGAVPVVHNHPSYHKSLQLLFVPKVSEVGQDETLRVITLIYDTDAPTEPKCFELINFNMDIAHPKDVTAGLLLSLIEGPLAEISYIKLKIDIIRDFTDALNSVLLPRPITK